MTPTARILRRIFFLPIKEAEERETRLRHAAIRTEHAHRVVVNAAARLERTANRLHLLTAETLERINGPDD